MSALNKQVSIDLETLMKSVPNGEMVTLSLEGDKSLGKGGLTLYHGTSLCHVEGIMRDGIKPRGDSSANHANMPSHSERTYLTEWNAFYYAYCAVIGQLSKGQTLAVAEVCLTEGDLKNLVADEDAVSKLDHATRHMPRVRCNMDWQSSLEREGTVGYLGTIPPSRIKRWVTAELSDSDLVALIAYKQLIKSELHDVWLEHYQDHPSKLLKLVQPKRALESPFANAVWRQIWGFTRPRESKCIRRMFNEHGVPAVHDDIPIEQESFDEWLKGKPTSMPAMMKLA